MMILIAGFFAAGVLAEISMDECDRRRAVNRDA
jgi:hypothetical protein